VTGKGTVPIDDRTAAGFHVLIPSKSRRCLVFENMEGSDMRFAIQLMIGFLTLVTFIAAPAFAQSSSQSHDSPQRVCPSGYTTLGEICVDEKNGDIVLPIDPKGPTGIK